MTDIQPWDLDSMTPLAVYIDGQRIPLAPPGDPSPGSAVLVWRSDGTFIMSMPDGVEEA